MISVNRVDPGRERGPGAHRHQQGTSLLTGEPLGDLGEHAFELGGAGVTESAVCPSRRQSCSRASAPPAQVSTVGASGDPGAPGAGRR